MERRTEGKIESIGCDRKKAHAFYAKNSEVYRQFLRMEGAAFSHEGIGKAAKEMIAIGISIVIHCESCLEWHIREALGAGASIEDVIDAIGVGMEMGGGPATVSARFAMDVLAYYAEHARVAEAETLAGLDGCAEVIRRSFADVALAFGLNPSNCPDHPAFIREERLLSMREQGACFFGAFVADRLAGCVAVTAREDTALIEKLAVLPGFRHRGLGKKLMEAVLPYARDKGCRNASIGIIDENRRLKDWYIGQGFHETEVKEYDHLPFAVCMMEKEV